MLLLSDVFIPLTALYYSLNWRPCIFAISTTAPCVTLPPVFMQHLAQLRSWRHGCLFGKIKKVILFAKMANTISVSYIEENHYKLRTHSC